MRVNGRSATATLLVAGAVAVWLTHALAQSEPELPRGPDPRAAPPGCLQVVSDPGGPITTIVYDPEQQVLGVYHVDRQSGAIELKSIRQIEWDLRMEHYNGKPPLPADIRNGLAP